MKNMPPHTFAPMHTCHYTMANIETACLSGRIFNYEYSHLLQLATIAIVYALITTEHTLQTIYTLTETITL